jgi:hypothetical protein
VQVFEMRPALRRRGSDRLNPASGEETINILLRKEDSPVNAVVRNPPCAHKLVEL